MNVKYLAIIIVGGLLLLAGCGSDTTTTETGPGNTNTLDPTPDLTPGLTLGSTLTGVVSASTDTTLTLDGVVFDTTNATFISDGSTDLGPGMVVTVEGTYSNGLGIAHKVKYDSEVEGVVISSDITAVQGVEPTDPTTYEGTMNVMGQFIIIDSMTMFKGVDDPTTIVKDNVVEISGMFDEGGVIRAKRVEYKADALLGVADEEVEVKGYVEAYDDAAGTFMLGECLITITANTVFDGIDVLEDGMKVEVESTSEFVQTDPICSIEALEIENEDRDGFLSMAKVEGMIVGELLDGMFMLQHGDNDPVKVMVDDSTQFVHGTADNIVDGTKLKVIGMYDETDILNVVLMAKLIKFEDMEMEFDKVKGTVTTELMDGMFKLEDNDGNMVTVNVNADTHFLPVGATAADIQLNARLKVVGMYNDINELVANFIKLEDVDILLEKVKGTVVSEPDIDGMFQLEDKDGSLATVVVNAETKYFPINATQADIKNDVMLKAVGTFDANNNLVASLITIQNMESVNPPVPGGQSMIKYVGNVESVVLDDTATPELGGQITVLGQTILVTADTRIFKQPMVDPIPPLEPAAPGGTTSTSMDQDQVEIMSSLADVNPGDYVMVMAYFDDTGVLTARVIEVKTIPAMPIMLMNKVFGPITSADVAANTLIIAGVTVVVIDTTEITPVDKYDMTTIDEAIQAGTELKAMVKGAYDATTGELTAEHISVHELNIIM
ncbi:MAG: hypothetical protein GXP19_05460 [Gammaproteobacteria bacterium]|nr:hypothetical protein [Gammaproteobacteria bacterium]